LGSYLSIKSYSPPLESIELRNTEIRDWPPLLFQTSLTSLQVWMDTFAPPALRAIADDG